MNPRLYVETTIPSYLVARRSRDLRLAADQETTQEWWEERRKDYELFVSEAVLEEVAHGDANFATKRLALLTGLPQLRTSPEADVLVEDPPGAGDGRALQLIDARGHVRIAEITE